MRLFVLQFRQSNRNLHTPGKCTHYGKYFSLESLSIHSKDVCKMSRQTIELKGDHVQRTILLAFRPNSETFAFEVSQWPLLNYRRHFQYIPRNTTDYEKELKTEDASSVRAPLTWNLCLWKLCSHIFSYAGRIRGFYWLTKAEGR